MQGVTTTAYLGLGVGVTMALVKEGSKPCLWQCLSSMQV